MTTTAPPRPAERHGFRVPLATGPAAAAEARRRVRAAIRSWPVPVEEDVALLLTSELVTNAVRHEAGQAVMLVISCSKRSSEVSNILPRYSELALMDCSLSGSAGC